MKTMALISCVALILLMPEVVLTQRHPISQRLASFPHEHLYHTSAAKGPLFSLTNIFSSLLFMMVGNS